MQMQVVRSNGAQVPAGHCIVPDNHVDTFTLQIRSLNGVSADELKALVERRFEVSHIAHSSRVTIAK